ncbi:MAG: protein kinase [Pseudomonadota bacterium]|nr:protein kinase [Pseudomonadota bacterium]
MQLTDRVLMIERVPPTDRAACGKLPFRIRETSVMNSALSRFDVAAKAPAVANHDALPVGTRFGEYEIRRVLGAGSGGIVYLARDHARGRDVALKEYLPAVLAARRPGRPVTIRSSACAEPYAAGLRSFIDEARRLARFEHPSLVKVHCCWEDNSTAYIVMPYLQGLTLGAARSAMAQPPDEAWIRSVIDPIIGVLKLLHREGVCHRDIAPDNIFVGTDGPPVLLNPGSAWRLANEPSAAPYAVVRPGYAPIEQYAGMTQLSQGPWTDLYALGAVLHFLLFGVAPAPATARAVQGDDDPIADRSVPGISARLLDAVAWALAIRPNQRPQSIEELAAALDGPPALDGGPALVAGRDAIVRPVGPVRSANSAAPAQSAVQAEATMRVSAKFSPPSRVATEVMSAAQWDENRSDENRSDGTSFSAEPPTRLRRGPRPAAPRLARFNFGIKALVVLVILGVVAVQFQLDSEPRIGAKAGAARVAENPRNLPAAPSALRPVAALATPAARPSVPPTSAMAPIAVTPLPPRPSRATVAVALATRPPALARSPAAARRLKPSAERGFAAKGLAKSARAEFREPTKAFAEPPPKAIATSALARLQGRDAGAVEPAPVVRQLAVAEPAVASSASEACAGRGFLARAICIDRECEQPWFRDSAQCIPILEVKRRRENR